MTDLEMIERCAEAMGMRGCPTHDSDGLVAIYEDTSKKSYSEGDYYDPLHDDAQVMALVKKFNLHIDPPDYMGAWGTWQAWHFAGGRTTCGLDRDLNRAIVECVAKMQDAKNGTAS